MLIKRDKRKTKRKGGERIIGKVQIWVSNVTTNLGKQHYSKVKAKVKLVNIPSKTEASTAINELKQNTNVLRF